MTRRSLAVIALGAIVCATTGCSAFTSYWQRHHRPRYTVTAAFYSDAPKRVAILPFTARFKDVDRGDITEAGARTDREACYRYVSVKSFEDIELGTIDDTLMLHGLLEDTTEPEKPGLAGKVTGALKAVDVTGISKLLNPLYYADQFGLRTREKFGEKRFERLSCAELKEIVPADAFVLGITEEHFWIYAVVFSYVQAGCKAQMRDAETGALLWEGRDEGKSFAWVVTDLVMLPIAFVKVWLNAQELKMLRVTDEMLRAMTGTMPDLDHPVQPEVRTTCSAVEFTRPGYSYFFWRRRGSVPEGTRMEYVLEQDGWYKVKRVVDGKERIGWIFGGHAELIDADDPDRVLRARLTFWDVFLQ